MDRLDALERLAKLRQQGMLSDAEFAAEKARLLAPGAPDPIASPASIHDRPFRADADVVEDGSASWDTDAAACEPAAGDAPAGSLWPKVAAGALAVAAVIGAAVWFGRSEVAPERPVTHTARKAAASAAPSDLPELSPQEAQRQAFVAAFGYAPPPAKSLSDRETEQDDDGLFRPVALVPVGSHLAVIATHEGLFNHAASGALAVRYVDRTTDGFRRLAIDEVRVETGTYGNIAGWKLRRDLAADPVIAVEGGGTWQGCTASWTDLIALAPAAPALLAKGIPTMREHNGEDEDEAAGGAFEATLARSGDAIVAHYTGEEDRTVRYQRDGDRLVPDSKPPPSC